MLFTLPHSLHCVLVSLCLVFCIFFPLGPQLVVKMAAPSLSLVLPDFLPSKELFFLPTMASAAHKGLSHYLILQDLCITTQINLRWLLWRYVGAMETEFNWVLDPPLVDTVKYNTTSKYIDEQFYFIELHTILLLWLFLLQSVMRCGFWFFC